MHHLPAHEDFVRSAVERLCDRTATLAEQRPRPAPEALADCVGEVLEPPDYLFAYFNILLYIIVF